MKDIPNNINCITSNDRKLMGLCHRCLNSPVELVIFRGMIICRDCYSKFQGSGFAD